VDLVSDMIQHILKNDFKMERFLRIITPILMLSMMIAGCNQKDGSSDIKVIRQYSEDGKVKAEYETVDSIRQGKGIIYYPDGKIKYKFVYKDNLEDGPAVAYFPSGKVKRVAVLSKGKFNGESIFYYESGNVSAKAKYFNDLIVGRFVDYYDDEDNHVKSIKEYVIVGNKSKLNTYTTYDVEGNVVDESTQLKFSEQNGSVRIDVINKEFKEIAAVVGAYDIFFNLTHKFEPDTIYGVNNSFVVIPHQGDTIRGYIINYEALDQEKAISKAIWFSYPQTW